MNKYELIEEVVKEAGYIGPIDFELFKTANGKWKSEAQCKLTAADFVKSVVAEPVQTELPTAWLEPFINSDTAKTEETDIVKQYLKEGEFLKSKLAELTRLIDEERRNSSLSLQELSRTIGSLRNFSDFVVEGNTHWCVVGPVVCCGINYGNYSIKIVPGESLRIYPHSNNISDDDGDSHIHPFVGMYPLVINHHVNKKNKVTTAGIDYGETVYEIGFVCWGSADNNARKAIKSKSIIELLLLVQGLLYYPHPSSTTSGFTDHEAFEAVDGEPLRKFNLIDAEFDDKELEKYCLHPSFRKHKK